MGGGQQAQAPTLDIGKTLNLNEGQLKLLQDYAPQIAQTMGQTSRTQDAQNVQFGLDMLVRPNETLQAAQLNPLRQRQNTVQDRIKNLEGRGDLNKQQRERLKNLRGREQRLGEQIAAVQSSDPLGDLTQTFAQEFGQRDQLLGQMEAAIPSGAEYTRLQDALGRGVQAQQADMERVQAMQTDESEIGARLRQEAMRKMDQGGQLSPEAQREAVQAARQGFAARGMATGNAALGAELLNRDRFARQREFENLGFAQGVEAADLGRRTQNTLLGQQAATQNAQAFNQLSQFNTGMRDSTNRYNMGLLADSANYADAERQRQLGMRQNIYNFGMSTNPRMMLAGLGSPYANMAQPALQSVTGLTANVTPQYSGGQFSSSGGMGSSLGSAAGGALSGAASGAMIGSVVPGIGTVAGAVGGGLLGGAGGYLSDKREKTDIKPLGALSNVLNLPAYEYRYKGEKKKRKGVMAQDVQKVLPEAVTEVDYRGKKRLAIKPAVIGAALAQELTEQSKAVAA